MMPGAGAARWKLVGCTLCGWLLAGPTWAAAPSVEQALKLSPIQQDVAYDIPAEDQREKCTITAEKIDGAAGWVVRGPGGQILRRFLDTNADRVVDQWCYYQHGVEVYRDIDENFNGKADQYRWFNSAGMRWGIDDNEDGTIDRWKQISAEELSAEMVAALAARDAARFGRALPSDEELSSLGLSAEQRKDIAARLEKARSDFAQLIRGQAIDPQAQWVQFAATRPGLVPAVGGATRDLIVYENALAMIRTGDKHSQVVIGTLVQTDRGWRAINAPIISQDDAPLEPRGLFFGVSLAGRTPEAEAVGGISTQMQKLFEELEQLDREDDAQQPDPAKIRRRVELLRQVAEAATAPEDKAQWQRQIADVLSTAAQTGAYEQGLEDLRAITDELIADGADKPMAAYFKYRLITAENVVNLQKPNADFVKLQEAWLTNLERFVEEYPQSPDAAEAMLQLGITQEFSGNAAEAEKWYRRIVQDFSGDPAAKKAAGAVRRLTSVGKQLDLQGRMTNGRPISLAQLRGKVVLVHYWATWCEPCKADLAQIRDLIDTYGKNFTAVGISLDTRPEELAEYLKRARLTWPQIYEPGGLDSRPAVELGVLTLPTMLLLDTDGKVINRNVHISELEGELKKLIRK